VDLNLLEIDGVASDGIDHLESITGGEISVGGGEIVDVGAVLLQERGLGEIGGVTSGGQDDGAVLGVSLSILLEFNADDFLSILDELLHVGLDQDLGTLVVCARDVLEHLHQGVGDGHTGESFLSTVSTGERVSSELGDERKVEGEAVLEPFDGGGRVTGEDLDELGAEQVLGRLSGIIVESLDGVLDAELHLGASESTVDTGGGLGGVSSQK